jgi:predicted O-methyltransferase YrrM
MRPRWLRSGNWRLRIVRLTLFRSVSVALAVLIAALVAQPVRPLVGVGVFLLAVIVCLSARQLLVVTAQLRQLASHPADGPPELWGLLGLLGQPGRLLPRLDGGAMDPDAVYALAELVARTEPSIVVELGPGASTVVLGLTAASLNGPMQIWSLESEPDWVAQAERLVAYHSIPRCRVIAAPLVEQSVGTWAGAWYSPEAVALIPDRIDLLIVDGPKNVRQNDARFPAYAAFQARLAPGSHVFVHDTDRDDETQMVKAWIKDPALTQEQAGRRFVVLAHR